MLSSREEKFKPDILICRRKSGSREGEWLVKKPVTKGKPLLSPISLYNREGMQARYSNLQKGEAELTQGARTFRLGFNKMTINSEATVGYAMVGIPMPPTHAIWRGKEIEPVQVSGKGPLVENYTTHQAMLSSSGRRVGGG
ncbi:hypothetical protein TNCV_1010181 [Trichonephila clavipes]|nr:hypothetical protein TNCV_1010181 [Trichonephila clavipes]